MAVTDRRASNTERQNHLLAECPQAPVIERLERDYDRVAGALEKIAEQGALVVGLRNDVDRHEEAFDEIFPRLRKIEEKHAHEEGAEEVVKEKAKFWTLAKIQLLQPGLLMIFFILWLLDKFGAITWLAKQFHMMGS